jgi:hypothetical protein
VLQLDPAPLPTSPSLYQTLPHINIKQENMSRSAADATRFTATGPYVGPKAPYKLPDFNKSKQKPPRPSNTNEPQDPKQQGGGGQETPRQKVERLRAQARAARLSQKSSLVDRIIERGGRAANGAHKVIIYTLIAASGMSFLSLSLHLRYF